MACFLVSAAEAAVVSAAEKKAAVSTESTASVQGYGFARKLKWLRNMLWGGTALLAFEHVWHGEVTAWFPFLTAASNPADAAQMLHEMSTVGLTMAALTTAVWACMVLVSAKLEKQAREAEAVEAQ